MVTVLNKYYTPIALWSINRAVTAIYLGKAQIVKVEAGKFISSVNRSFPVPSVIRLERATYTQVVKYQFSRKAVFRRDAYTCQYCGSIKREDLTIDHIVPKSRGGEDSWTNCTTACMLCNNRKGNRTPEEMGWRRPKAVPYLFFDFDTFYDS